MQGNSTTPTSKRCHTCREILPADKFYVVTKNNGRTYLSAHCRACSTKVRYQWAHSAKGKERIEVYKARTRARHASDKTIIRTIHMKAKYGLTLDEYQSLLAKQNGVCAICHRPEKYKSRQKDGSIRALCVDHAHDETRRVRGLLCAACNKALGLFLDDPALLNNAILYLQQST